MPQANRPLIGPRNVRGLRPVREQSEGSAVYLYAVRNSGARSLSPRPMEPSSRKTKKACNVYLRAPKATPPSPKATPPSPAAKRARSLRHCKFVLVDRNGNDEDDGCRHARSPSDRANSTLPALTGMEVFSSSALQAWCGFHAASHVHKRHLP